MQFHPEVVPEIVEEWALDYRSDPDAIAMGFDPPAHIAEAAERLPAWMEIGRELFEGFLATAASVVPRAPAAAVDQLWALHPRAVDRGVGRARRRARGGQRREQLGVVGAGEPGGLLVGAGQHDRHPVVDRRADLVGARGEDRRRRDEVLADLGPAEQPGEREQLAAVDRVAERHPRLLGVLGAQPLVPAVGEHQAAAVRTGEQVGERLLVGDGLAARVDRRVALAELLRPGGHEPPADGAHLALALLGRDDRDLLGRADVEAPERRPPPGPAARRSAERCRARRSSSA